VRPRTRTATIAATLSLVLAIAVVVTTSRHHHPSRRTAVPPPAPSVTSAPVPYLVDGRTLHLGSRVIALPDGWIAKRGYATLAGVVLDVSTPAGELAALASGDGSLQRLDQIRPPLAVAASGTLLAGTAPARASELVLFSVPSQAVIAHLDAPNPLSVLNVLSAAGGTDEFLVQDETDSLLAPEYLVWRPQQQTLTSLTGQADAGPVVALTPGGDWYSLGTGTFFASLVRHDRTGHPRWAMSLDWPSPSIPQLSPRADRLVADSTTTGIVRYIDAGSGREVDPAGRVTASLPFEGGSAPVWLDEDTLVVSRLLGPHGSALYRCRVGVPACTLIARSAGRITPVVGPWSSAAG
jgi:hypothetical protein